MHNKYNLQTFDISHYPSKLMLSNFLTKALSAPALLRESSFAMGHMHLAILSTDHYRQLTARSNLSTIEHYLPAFEKSKDSTKTKAKAKKGSKSKKGEEMINHSS